MADPIDIDADLVSRGDIIRIPGERRRYRVRSIRPMVLIPRRGQDIPVDDRARIELALVPVSRGGSAHRITVRPTDRVLAY